MTDDELADALRPRKPRSLMNHTFAVLGWCHRAVGAVGSPRFGEIISRAANEFQKAAQHAHTPGDSALLTGLNVMIDDLVVTDAQVRALLTESVSGMNAAEATEFVEMVEGGDEFPYPAI